MLVSHRIVSIWQRTKDAVTGTVGDTRHRGFQWNEKIQTKSDEHVLQNIH